MVARRDIEDDAARTIDQAWFAGPVCRNCGAGRDSDYCPACGQKAAVRLTFRDIRKESWERLRLFEIKSLRTIGRLVTRPGTVARDYVLGRRTVNMNPLALLIALVAILVVVLAASRYFEVYRFSGRDADVERMAARVMGYANWSFTTGIVAIFAASFAVFGKRLGYNAIEHAVLAVYCQCLILAAIILNLLPTLIWRDPGFVLAHKAASQYYLYAIKLAIVAVGYRQFFLLRGTADTARLAIACLLYIGLSWVLLRAYAAAILWLVIG